MNHRNTIYSALVAVLLGTNIWYWWTPDAADVKRETRTGQSSGYRPEDFRLKLGASSEGDGARMQRDLFQAKVEVVKPKLPPVASKPPEPPPKTAEELQEEAARAELAQYKLVGVAFRGGKGQAFVTRGEQVYMVIAGEKVGDRFTVEKIVADAIELRDPATNVAGKIPVSGK